MYITRFPFDWKNPTGYLIAATMQFIMISYNLFYVACTTSLCVGTSLFLISVVNDLKSHTDLINNSAKSKKENRLQTLKLLSEFIDIHSISLKLKSNSICSLWIWIEISNWSIIIFAVFQISSRLFKSISIIVCQHLFMESGHNMLCDAAFSNGNSLVFIYWFWFYQ